MSKTVVRKNESLEVRYVDLNVQFLKVEQSKKYVNVNFTKNQA
ncbi:30S ribosomal protein S21 [Staphylococcus aureus]|nr:30S ribosomal protein S21 [Staphylococcus aureus]